MAEIGLVATHVIVTAQEAYLVWNEAVQRYTNQANDIDGVTVAGNG